MECHTVSHALSVVGGNSEHSHLTIELLPVPANIARGLRLVALEATESLFDHQLLSGLMPIPVAVAVGAGRRETSGCANFVRDAVLGYKHPRCQYNESLDDIFQLSNIPGPFVMAERVENSRRQFLACRL